MLKIDPARMGKIEKFITNGKHLLSKDINSWFRSEYKKR